MSDILSAVEKLLKAAGEFPAMEAPRKAAFRASLTRLEKQVTDPELAAILADIRAEVGEPEARQTPKLTAGDLEGEFPKFAGYDSKRRGAYKAKLSRLLKETRDANDGEAVNRLLALQSKVAELETRETMKRIRALANKRKAG